MLKVLACSLLVLGGLAGCSSLPQDRNSRTPCAADPGGYDCQIERYQRAPG